MYFFITFIEAFWHHYANEGAVIKSAVMFVDGRVPLWKIGVRS